MNETPPPGPVLADFSDSVGPMVVKELRQGLRTRSFTWAFLFVQLLLLIFMTGGFTETSDSRDTAGSFWFLLQVTLLVVMPLRGLNALNAEVRNNTMELIALTRMSAWRIVSGKWLALMSQSVLLAVAVLPYIVIRYFFGGMNVVAELILLFVVIGLSGVVTALMVGLSVVSNFLIRSFFTVPAVVLVFRFLGESVYRVSRGDGLAPFNLGLGAWIGIVPAAIYLGYYLLDMAASRIAPEAVNYASRRRISGLAVFVVSLVVAHGWAVSGALWIPFLFFGLFAMDALSEHPPMVASVDEPFRRHPLGAVLRIFLAPGWWSGTFYVLLLSALTWIAAQLEPSVWMISEIPSGGEMEGLVLAFTASLLTPLAVMLLSRPSHPQPIVSYSLTAIFLGTIAVSLMPFIERGDLSEVMMLAMVIPPLSVFSILSQSQDSDTLTWICFLQAIMIILSIVVVFWKKMRLREAMAASRREEATL